MDYTRWGTQIYKSYSSLKSNHSGTKNFERNRRTYKKSQYYIGSFYRTIKRLIQILSNYEKTHLLAHDFHYIPLEPRISALALFLYERGE